MAEVKSHKVKQLSSRLDPNAIYWVQASANLPIEGFITDINGVPYPLKDISGTGGITSITNTDGNIQIVGATGVVINLSTSLLSTISSALQSGDNISELFNDSNFITLLDLPTNTSELINDGANGTSTYVESSELGAVAISNSYNDLDDLPTPITKTSDLINDGDDGVSHFISLEDLPSNLVFYPTSAASDILGYIKIVTSITDPSYDSVAVDINTGGITGSNQLIASLATSANIIVGNPGLLNITTIGNIKRISGSGTAEFYFEVYKRDSLGVETLITTSSNTSPIESTIYSQFSTTALWNNGEFVDTDRIVLKFYGTKIGGGSNPTYNFQFGGGNPVRTLVPIPLNVVPNLDVAFIDLTDTPASYAGQAGKVAAVNVGETALEFIDVELGKIRIIDKLGEFFTDLATANAYVSSFTLATLTNESYADGVYYFTVPNGTSFAQSTFFLGNASVPKSAYIEDTLGLINTFGGSAFSRNSGNNILRNCSIVGVGNAFENASGNNTFRNCTFGVAFFNSSGNNTFGNCTFGTSFGSSSSNNIFGNCTFGNNSFVSASGINRFKNILLTNPTDFFAASATGRFEIYGNIGTTEAANYTNFFAASNATIWADKSKETSNGGALEGDLATAQANGSKLFFGYVPAGGGGATAWGDITGTLSDQTDLQNALNARVKHIISDSVASSPVTGTLVETIAKTYTIPANSFLSTLNPKIHIKFRKIIGTANTVILRVYMSNVNDFPTSSVVGTVNFGSTLRNGLFERIALYFDGATLIPNVGVVSSSLTDNSAFTGIPSPVPLDQTQVMYFWVTLQNLNITDSALIQFVQITD